MCGEHENTVAQTSLPIVTIYSDGSSKPMLGTGGYGVIMSCGMYSEFIYGGAFGASNNAMELYAVLTAIRRLTCPCRINVVSDSKYVVDGINGWVVNWANHNWRKADGAPISNMALWQEMYAHTQNHIITATWIKGHSTTLANTVCDQLACIGAYTEANVPIPSKFLDINRA